jgi:hypothetical protein
MQSFPEWERIEKPALSLPKGEGPYTARVLARALKFCLCFSLCHSEPPRRRILDSFTTC